ncbi:trichohyalin-like [Hypanus sabinus]|uniref:trichohyalin-like n=1 Tax=Hypanus sabinus TaxID=79690 RepID=UPI0028C3A6DD|nr:trichohyalin-like [Hypanus sabinus]XP_059816175.1 trichohyalin-like [Hypanus sabinus]
MAVWPMGPYLQIDPLGRGRGSSKLPPISSETPGFSKLDVLKERLQQRLERERQAKLTAMYRQQYHQALLRLRATCLPQAPRPPQPYRAEEQQPSWLPGAKRCPGIDRSQPLKPIDRAVGPCSDVSPGDPESDWQRLPRQEAPQRPGVSYRPSPHKAPSDRDRETELEPPRPLHRGRAGQRPQPCSLADQGRSLTHARSRENLIEQQLRRIEAELRDIQRQREAEEDEEKEDEEGAECVEIMRVERERGWQRERRDSLGRHRSEEERSEGESSEGERWGRLEREGSEADRERSERKRSERQRSRRTGERSRRSEGERPGRSEGMRPGRHWSESERGKKEIGSEREERGRARERNKREKWERSEKERLGEIEREVKLRDRVRVRGGSRVGGGNWESAHSHRVGGQSDGREGGSDRGAAVGDESPQVAEEDCDHSNPFAGYSESPAEEKQNSRNTETECGDGEQSGDVGWDGHYSPEEKAHCSYCGRRFVLDRLDTHTEICKKVYMRKRKIYDSAQKRAKGTDLENYQCSHKIVPIPKVNWKKKHDSFIRMLHAAQQAELEVYRRRKAAQTAPAGANRPDFIQCPSCSRRFEHSVAEGHIPKCMSLRSWPGPSKR